MEGWISLHRSIQKNWIWEDKPFSKGQAWIDILLMVNHEDRKLAFGNELIVVTRGSRITSIRQLCYRWGWSNTKVKSFLSMLQQDNMLRYKSDTKKTLLTVVNYSEYQDTENKKTTQKHHRNDTETSQKHTNNNDNNDNNDNKKDNSVKLKFDEDSIEYKLANYLKNWMLKNNPNAKVPNDIKSMQKWCIHIDRMIRIDNRKTDEIKEIIKFCQTDEFWLSNILSTNKLREKYDKLYLKMKGTSKGGDDFGQGYTSDFESNNKEGEIEYDFNFNNRTT